MFTFYVKYITQKKTDFVSFWLYEKSLNLVNMAV